MPSSTTAGGVKAYTRALRMLAKAIVALRATSGALSSFRSRSSQSLSLANTIALFCDRPEKLMPVRVITEATASVSFSSK